MRPQCQCALPVQTADLMCVPGALRSGNLGAGSRPAARGAEADISAAIHQVELPHPISDFSLFGQKQSILDVNTEIMNGVLDLGVPK